MLRWYLIHTKPSSETTAQANLDRQGYEVYLPRLLQSIRRGGSWCNRIAPLFPRYLFLRLNEGCQSLGPVRSSVGVTAVVRFGFDYAVVPDQVVRDLQSRADPESGLHRLSPPPQLTPGARVSITAGPFDGLDGVFQQTVGGERVVVLLRLLGQIARVRVPICCISPMQPA